MNVTTQTGCKLQDKLKKTLARMRVLYFSPRDCWPVTTGARLRDFHLACQLSSHAELLYLGFVAGEGKRERLAALNGSEVVLAGRDSGYAPLNLVRGLIGPTPISVLNYTSPRMMAELEQLLRTRDFDVIQIEGVHLFTYAKHIRELAPRTRLFCDWHNIESELLARYSENDGSAARRLYARRTAALLRRLEQELLDLADLHTVCSERERSLLLERAPSARIEVIGNGVDTAYFGEAARAAAPRRSLVFVGSMDYHANIDAAAYFAREIWPLVRTGRPELEFVVVGSRPAAEVLALGELAGVTVTGTVEDIRPYYTRALAVVVPLRVGSGTRLKVLEAMAAGVPVISTTLGAEGLAVTPGVDILIADTPAATAAAAVALDPENSQWLALARNAHSLVATQYDWSIMGEKLWQLYLEHT